MSTSNPTDRYHSLDFLRAVAVLGVMLHFVLFRIYHPIGLRQITIGLARLSDRQWHSPISNAVLFIIAGFWRDGLPQKGTGYFADRFKRIAIPFVVGCHRGAVA